MAFKDIFKDENEFNEKTIIGFMSFAVITLVDVQALLVQKVLIPKQVKHTEAISLK